MSIGKKRILILLAICGLFSWPILFVLHPDSAKIDQEIPPEPADQRMESADSILYEGERSGQWARVRANHIASNPACEACRSMKDLNVHHIKPFHSNPELELDPKNLITLCREHHFRIGHDPDGPWKPQRPGWSKSNPSVRKHAQQWRESR